MQLSDGEWIVMNLIWDSQPTEASDVIDALGAENRWSDATVKTMLHRLVKKGALTAEPIGKKYRYSCAVRKNDCIRQASRSFLDHVFSGQATPALMHFVKTSRLSDEDLDQLRELLDSKASSKTQKNKGSKE